MLAVIAAVNSVIAFFYYAASCAEMWIDSRRPTATRRPVRVPAALDASPSASAAAVTVVVVGVYPQLVRPHRRPRLRAGRAPTRLMRPMRSTAHRSVADAERDRSRGGADPVRARSCELALYGPDGLLHQARRRGPGAGATS